MSKISNDLPSGSGEREVGTLGGFTGSIREQAESYTEKRKADVSRVVSDVAEAIRASSADFGSHQHVKAFFDSAADGIQELSEKIDQRTFGEIYGEVEATVRRNPSVTVAAAAFAGFVLFRFLKASKIPPVPRSYAMVPVDVLPTQDV
ncbi:hypothetical protein [Methylobacterium sp. E-045]|uniref:hypothetical protein n=1 Tax=Methylobacterium sp. E-045 TaxID=2836575 RepID=UPI001FB95989|nr:hypothetical protein [Methylobacterium sp. E-045]MCJ2127287.1 hypothetical protein [Methylobacterium sp. E-045]